MKSCEIPVRSNLFCGRSQCYNPSEDVPTHPSRRTAFSVFSRPALVTGRAKQTTGRRSWEDQLEDFAKQLRFSADLRPLRRRATVGRFSRVPSGRSTCNRRMESPLARFLAPGRSKTLDSLWEYEDLSKEYGHDWFASWGM